MAEVIKCVFANVSSVNPFYRGANDECFAQAGEKMRSCCYHVGRRLVLSDQVIIVQNAIASLEGRSWLARSRRSGLNAALNK